MDYRQKLADLGIEVHKVRGEQGYTTCPKCSHTRKKKKDPCLSVNTTNGAYNCHHCDWQGNVRFEQRKPKEYVRPTFRNQTECAKEVVDWFAGRGINQLTLINNKVKSGPTWLPQTGKEEYCIQFNYFRKGELINIKHRDAVKNFRLEKDAELIFYGLDDLKDTDPYILIAEGEVCKLSWNEAGVNFALSVPNGASKSATSTLEYLDNCWSYFENDKKVILALDNDEAGMMLREELSRRLGKSRCYKIDFRDVKDANDYLVKYGPDKLRELIAPANLIEYPIRGVVELRDIWGDVQNVIKNGLTQGLTTGVYPDLDDHISFDGGKLCVVTGIPNSGKSPFIDLIMICLSIQHGWKWAVVAMEGKPLHVHITGMMEKILGKSAQSKNSFTEEEMEMCRIFLEEHFHFIEANAYNNENDTLEFILASVQDLVAHKGIHGVTIDPWNKIEHDIRKGENETNYVSRVLDQIIRSNQKYNLFTFLIAHPTKVESDKSGDYKVPKLYDVSGSSNFYNKPDWGMTVHRNYKTGLTEIYITKAKWKHLGKVGQFTLRYNPVNGRLGHPTEKMDFTNWLKNLPIKSNSGVDPHQPINYDVLEQIGGVGEDLPF